MLKSFLKWILFTICSLVQMPWELLRQIMRILRDLSDAEALGIHNLSAIGKIRKLYRKINIANRAMDI